jgi:hypothetical protein
MEEKARMTFANRLASWHKTRQQGNKTDGGRIFPRFPAIAHDPKEPSYALPPHAPRGILCLY